MALGGHVRADIAGRLGRGAGQKGDDSALSTGEPKLGTVPFARMEMEAVEGEEIVNDGSMEMGGSQPAPHSLTLWQGKIGGGANLCFQSAESFDVGRRCGRGQEEGAAIGVKLAEHFEGGRVK